MRSHETLVGGFAEPVGGLYVILRNPTPIPVVHPSVVLSLGILHRLHGQYAATQQDYERYTGTHGDSAEHLFFEDARQILRITDAFFVPSVSLPAVPNAL